MVPKQSPDLLANGQYRSVMNVVSNQEGSISSRLGIKKVGQISSGLNNCYFVRKLVVSNTEDPLVPSTNPRYLGVLTTAPARNIYRTIDYVSTTLVVSGADSNAARHWEMADYSAGETGAPWAYFACPNGMFKDSGLAPAGTLPKWGIQPACGSALAAAVTASISVIDANQDRGVTGPVAVFLASPSGVSDGDVVPLTGIGIVPDTCATGNGNYYAKVIGYSNSSADPYFAGSGQGSVFGLYDSLGAGVLPSGAFTPGGTVTVVAAGNLNGGAESSPNNTQPYDWVYTYQETSTSDEGNPSQAMLAGSTATDSITGVTYNGFPLAINGGQALVAVWGTGVAGIGNLKVYRRGGALIDGIYRLVATVANPGSETVATITDNTGDADLVYAQPGDGIFNYPPVVSTLQTPIKTSPTGSISTGWQTVTVAASVLGPVLPGTTVHIIDPLGSEDVIVESSTVNTFRAYFQIAHASGIPIEIDAITGSYCNLAISMQDSLIVAGDPNNPHLLYKSANGSPQYFPVGLDAAGAVTSIGVGTPANGIVNMCEFRGQVLTLNISNLFEVAVINGSLFLPAKVADKGLAAQSAWCKTDTEVWFLSDDGIYSWDGSSLRQRSIQIDGIFHGLDINGIPPLTYEPAQLQAVRMEFRGGYIHFAYTVFGGGLTELICEPRFSDRWINAVDAGSVSNPSPNKGTTMIYREPDTKSLIIAGTNTGGAVFGIANSVVVSGLVNPLNYVSDWWSSGPSADGSPILWNVALPWFDMGRPNWKKVFEEVWLDIDPQLYNGVYPLNSTLSIAMFLDYSTTATATFSITPPGSGSIAGRQLIALLPLLASVSGTYESFGQEARAISFVISGSAYPVQSTLFGLVIQYQDTGLLTAGGATDWDSLGYKYDKRLYQMTVEFDVEGTDQTLLLDTINGINGNTFNQAVQSFVLDNPVLTGMGPGRAKKTFPITDSTIAKLVRVRPVATIQAASTLATAFFKVHSVEFEKEEYPPDIVSQTPWNNGGYAYLKYANQLDLEVNTNGVAVTVNLQADSATVFTFTVTSTTSDRQRNITIPPNKSGYQWRLYVDPGQTAITSGGGEFQLFNHSIKFQQADKGEVQHTFDWDDLGYPYDKRLYTVTIQWDNTGGSAVTMVLDLLSGIGGGTVQSAVQTFSLGTAGRSEKTFPLIDGLIAKDIRLYPQTTPLPLGFKSWKYIFQKEEYPADIVAFTSWENGGSEYSKYLNQLDLEVNTNGVDVTVQVQADSATVFTFVANATEGAREVNVTIPSGLQGKMWRLYIDPTQSALVGGGGKFQLFRKSFKFQPADKGEVGTTFDWDDLGHPFDKYLRTVTVEWDGALDSGTNVTLQLDTLTGIGGQTVNTAIATFLLSGGRSKCTFAIAEDTIAKMIRLYPVGATIPFGFKQWKYLFDFEKYPADTILSAPWKDASSGNDKNPSWLWIDADTQGVPASVVLQDENGTVLTVNHTGSVDNRKKNYPIQADVFAKMWRLLITPGSGGKFQMWLYGFDRWQPVDEASGVDPCDVLLWTPWNDFGYPYPKLARNLILTINTGGVACSIALQTQEAGTVQTFSVSTTYTTRRVVLPCNPNLSGTQWRLLLTPGGGGLAKLWSWALEVIKEPAAVNQWSSYEQTFGWKFWKFVKQGWWMYTCASPVTLTITSDTGVFSVTLPAHLTRAVERFLLPTVWGNGLNKSKTYSVELVSTNPADPFQFYAEGSGLEWLEFGADRHNAYRQMNFNELMTLGEGGS